jgi:hypothetical protein
MTAAKCQARLDELRSLLREALDELEFLRGVSDAEFGSWEEYHRPGEKDPRELHRRIAAALKC